MLDAFSVIPEVKSLVCGKSFGPDAPTLNG
jgi:hypothetical protein